MDDDDQLAEDLEGKDITSCKEDIEQLYADKERRLEYTERLQEKLKALNNELAARNEEFDRRNKELQEEQRRNKRKADQNREANEAGGALVQLDEAEHTKIQREQVRSLMENQLGSLLQQKSSSAAMGMPLVQKPQTDVRKEQIRIDTVLITYLKANTDEKYYLSYRVGEKVTAAVLRRDACMYWGLSEVEYILWTHTEGSKIHDELLIQNCFKPNEEARLVLRRKTPQEVRVMERERDAIRPLIGRGRKTGGKKKGGGGAADAGAEVAGRTEPDGILEQMEALPGLRDFMTRRDEYNIDHLDRVKLRNILLYGFLIIVTIASIWTLIPPDVEYTCREGVYQAMTRPTGSAVDFNDIYSEQDAWSWLMNTVPDQLLVNTSMMRTLHYLPGWLRLRVQRVKAPSRDQCKYADFPAGVACHSDSYSPETAATEVLTSIQTNWQERDDLDANRTGEAGAVFESQRAAAVAAMVSANEDQVSRSVNDSNVSNITTTTLFPTTTSAALSQDVRGSLNPWTFLSAEEGEGLKIGAEGGFYQRYDPSGYEVDYNLQFPDIAELNRYYRQDMQILKDGGWIDQRTRAVHVHFATYSGNFDHWVSSHFLIEMPGSGVMHTSVHMEIYKPVISDYEAGIHLFTMDSVRFLVVLYILCLNIPWEMAYESRVKGSVLTYLFRAAGIADLGIVSCFMTAYGIRYLTFGIMAVDTVTYRKDLTKAQTEGETWISQTYRLHVVLDAIILCFTIFRFVSFLRANRQVYVIIEALKQTFSACKFLLFCILPGIPGFVVLAHMLWRPYLTSFRTLWSSLASILMLLLGQRDLIEITYDNSRPWTAVFAVLFYALVVIFLTNSILATLVNVYQRVRITSGYYAKLYDWEEYQYVQWSLFKPFATMYAFLRGSRMRIPFVEDED